MKKILFSLVSSLLFISLAFFPFIEGETEKKFTGEVTVEICTPNGVESLTKELPFDVIERLSVLQSQDDVDGLLDALEGLGLVGEFSIKEVREFIAKKHLEDSKLTEKIEGVQIPFLNPIDDRITNAFCSFVTDGSGWGIFPYNFIPIFLWYLLFSLRLGTVFEILINYLLYFPTLLVDSIPHFTTIGFWKIEPWRFAGRGGHSSVSTKGIFGESSIERGKTIYAFTIGFTGIIISLRFGAVLRRSAYGFALFASAW